MVERDLWQEGIDAAIVCDGGWAGMEAAVAAWTAEGPVAIIPEGDSYRVEPLEWRYTSPYRRHLKGKVERFGADVG